MLNAMELVIARMERRLAATERELGDAQLAIRHLAAMVESGGGQHAMAGQADHVRWLVTARLSTLSSHSEDERAVDGPIQA